MPDDARPAPQHPSTERPLLGGTMWPTSTVGWLGRQRSTLNVIATVLTVCAALFFGFFVIGEGLGGA